MDRYAVHIFVGFVKADTEEEAMAKATKRLEDLAGSNDGSELLANARPEIYWQDPNHTFEE